MYLSEWQFDGEIIVLFSTLVFEKSDTTSRALDLNHSHLDVMYPGYNNKLLLFHQGKLL